VVAHTAKFQNAFLNMVLRATTPSAPASVASRNFLMAQTPLLTRRGLRYSKVLLD
jgi:hypothetical protein